ncbi:hypothetical protein [Candidatus Wolbachia massiliensis]|uniref:Uncharacterized protein n=1 Tax=Candidatus Wolbachia massiliensis TaxID=1845000 RepID=A0A7M3U2F7_9RICK|nr:hypothetical protein [Candidatus Wolbachia massiliensis]QOD38592.1 hypothetical protein ID128_01780 [Candidatus Wolbachia massiliensis]
MPGTIEMSEEHLKTFYAKLIKKRQNEIDGVREKSKKSKKQNIEILEKHFYDRTL